MHAHLVNTEWSFILHLLELLWSLLYPNGGLRKLRSFAESSAHMHSGSSIEREGYSGMLIYYISTKLTTIYLFVELIFIVLFGFCFDFPWLGLTFEVVFMKFSYAFVFLKG